MNSISYFLAELLAVGSHNYDNNKETEIYSFKTNQWRRLQQFPYIPTRDRYELPSVFGLTAVYLKGYFYTFGGNCINCMIDRLNNIERLDPIQGTFLLKF